MLIPLKLQATSSIFPCRPGSVMNSSRSCRRPPHPMVRGRSTARRRLAWADNVRIGIVLGTSAEWVTIWEWDSSGGGRLAYGPQEHRQSLVWRTKHQLKMTGPVHQSRPPARAGTTPWLRRNMAPAGLGRYLPGRRLRHGGDTDVAGRFRQPAGPVAPQRRARRPRPGPSIAIATAS